jgi:hypothetical protein
VQRGTHQELVAQPGIYQQTYDLQARIEAELEQEIASADERRNGNGNGRSNGQFAEQLRKTISVN